MNGWFTEMVDSSWIEALGGLSRCEMRSVPPDFCARAGTAPHTKAAQDAARIAQRESIFPIPPRRTRTLTLFVLLVTTLADHLQRASVKATRAFSTDLSARSDFPRDR